MEKFQTHFASKIVKNLEKNVLKVIDPEQIEKARFQKIDYKLPKEIQEILANEDNPDLIDKRELDEHKDDNKKDKKKNIEWKNILNKVNLANI
jgi:hypothetical protein